MRTYWLSFAQGKFLGAAIVEVNEADAALALADLKARFPKAQPGAEWIAAATRKAWMTGCNPGGEVLSADIDPAKLPKDTPRNTLMSKEELFRRGLVNESDHIDHIETPETIQ